MNNLSGRYGSTPSDARAVAAADLPYTVPFDGGFARALRVGTAGNVTLTTYDGTSVTINNVQAGETIELVYGSIDSGTADDFTVLR